MRSGGGLEGWRSRWRQYRSLGADERRTLHQAAALLPVAGLCVRVLGFRRLHAAVTRWIAAPDPAQRQLPSGAIVDRARATGRLVSVAGHYLRAECLSRSIVLWYLLRREGIQACMRIGVGKLGDAVEFHAWVECAGQPIAERSDVARRFQVFGEGFWLAGPDVPGSRSAASRRHPTG